MDVVCAVIIQNHKFMLARRPLHKASGGKWEFPGGKLESGESQSQGLARELLEELGIAVPVEVMQKFGTVATSEGEFHFFKLPLQQPYAAKEHMAICWTTFDQLSNYDLCPVDQQAVATFSSVFKANPLNTP